MQTTRRDARTPAGRPTSLVTAVLHALQASDEPRRLDTLAHDTGRRDAHDVSGAIGVLLAQGLATRTPRGYAVTKLGRRAAGGSPSTEASRLPRAVAPSRQSGRRSRV